MKTNYLLTLTTAMLFLMTSCFVTRYVSDEKDLQAEFVGKHVEDVEFKFGQPDRTLKSRTRSGYVYVYNRTGQAGQAKEMTNQYVRIMFNQNDVVTAVESTTTKQVRSFSIWRSIGLPAIIAGALFTVSVVAVMALASAAQ
jgi:hypothetical protein